MRWAFVAVVRPSVEETLDMVRGVGVGHDRGVVGVDLDDRGVGDAPAELIALMDGNDVPSAESQLSAGSDQQGRHGDLAPPVGGVLARRVAPVLRHGGHRRGVVAGEAGRRVADDRPDAGVDAAGDVEQDQGRQPVAGVRHVPCVAGGGHGV